MITLRMTADVSDDRRIVVTLPAEVPTGKAELVVTVESSNGSAPQLRCIPASVVRGIAAGIGMPPDDETVERWLQERRADKFG